MNIDFELIAIKACLVASLYPFSFDKSNNLTTNKKRSYLFFLILCLVSIYLKSRLLFIGILVTFCYNHKITLKPKLLILLSIFGIIILFFLNTDSAIGRFLIWKIIFSNLHNVPFNGFGIDSFRSIYANWQSDYFEANQIWSKYHFVADSPSFAYNEILNFYVEFGMFSIIPFLIIAYINISFFKKCNNFFFRNVIISNLVILFFAQFSFPLHNLLILTIFVCNHLILLLIIFKNVKSFIILICITLIMLITFLIYQNIKVKADWHYAKTIPTQYKIEKVNQYQDCYLYLKNNPYYLYDFCQYLISEGMTIRALEIINLNKKHFNQYEKYLLLGDIYLRKNDLVCAKLNYKKANFIIPNRFIPLGNLMIVSLIEKDTLVAKYYSSRIISQPIKIGSVQVKRIKDDAYKILNIK